MLIIEIMSSLPRISLMTEEPPAVTLNVTLTGPSMLVPSQVPGMFLMAVNAFSASVCAAAQAAESAMAARIRVRVRFVMSVPFLLVRILGPSRIYFRFVRGLFVLGLGLAGVLGFHEFLQLVQARCP